MSSIDREWVENHIDSNGEVFIPDGIEKIEPKAFAQNNKVKRIVFCTSYLQLHIDDLPQKYKDNNYCLLIMEII